MKISFRHLAVGMVMMASAAAAAMLEPSRLAVEKGKGPDLAALIPKEFGGWREVPSVAENQVETAVPGTVSKPIYDQTLMRNYLGPHGELVMIAVAYGVTQNDELKVHRPEVCYSAQGFQILESGVGELQAGSAGFPVTRLVTRNGSRIEPVTYWIRIGGEVMRGGMQQRLAIIEAGLMGTIPDGLLFRVSTIVDSESLSGQAFRTQSEFLSELLGSIDRKRKIFLLGDEA